MRRSTTVAAALVVLGLAACTSAPERALAPATADGYDTDETGFFAAVQTSPSVDTDCGEDVEWDEPPVVDQVIAVGFVQTVWMVGERGGNELVWVCDYLPEGEEGAPVTAEPLASTGTDQPVGNDYVERVGSVLGRVDVGIPEGAVTAEYAVGDYVVTYPLDGDVRFLRLHAREDSATEDAPFTMGTVTFLDADGTDITPESVEIPDIIHGVPRDRDNGAEVPADDG
ncbi:hypothetical protein [Euzebya rosea]|uniref:hypothetical protein n=1 Tax=Euzebya rosea TaxID=2052804 RepID=UPI000D3E3471|nr:hypothetical protein [Euzebya rosea]